MGLGNSKTLRLLSVLARNPAEFRDRALTIAEGQLSRITARRPVYAIAGWESVVARLGDNTGCDLGEALNDPQLADHLSRLNWRMQSLPPEAPFRTSHNGDLALGKLCYAVVRALEPESVLETGVCYGVISAFILAALDRNRKGSLHSIDLPPLGRNGDRFVGWAIPDASIKTRWHLHRGVSRRILPKLLQQIGPVGLFVHDSLHTHRNMRREFEAVTPYLGRPGVLISDDVEGNSAFQEWVEQYEPDFSAVLKEESKEGLLGIGLFVKGAPATAWDK